MVEAKKPETAEEKMYRLEKKFKNLKDTRDDVADEDNKVLIINDKHMQIRCKKTVLNYEIDYNLKAKPNPEG